MLLGYGARNCWCFKDWMQVNLELDGSVPADISMNLPASTAMCFKGANASGKTSGLKVLAFISDFAKNSFQYPTDSIILFDTYFFQEGNAEFYVEFLRDGVYYRYETELDQKTVVTERLFRIKAEEGSRETEVFTRKGNDVIKNSLFKGNLGIKYRSNASFISTLHQYEIPEIAPVYDFFKFQTLNVNYIGLIGVNQENYHFISEIYSKNPKLLSFVEETINRFDTGVKSIEIKSKVDEKNQTVYYPWFIHELEDGRNRPLLYESESSGTRALFHKLLEYYTILDTGGVLVLDEFDINLHPDILPHLLDLFLVKENNPKNAQLIFTSHNTDIMDILGRYRTYIFEKENNESFCYRLDEPKSPSLRNDRPVSVPYKKHLIGGFPKIGNKKD